MTTQFDDFEELIPENTVAICGCGFPLVPILNNGVRTGVTHRTPEEDEHHCKYFADINIKEPPTL